MRGRGDSEGGGRGWVGWRGPLTRPTGDFWSRRTALRAPKTAKGRRRWHPQRPTCNVIRRSLGQPQVIVPTILSSRTDLPALLRRPGHIMMWVSLPAWPRDRPTTRRNGNCMIFKMINWIAVSESAPVCVMSVGRSVGVVMRFPRFLVALHVLFSTEESTDGGEKCRKIVICD